MILKKFEYFDNYKTLQNLVVVISGARLQRASGDNSFEKFQDALNSMENKKSTGTNSVKY